MASLLKSQGVFVVVVIVAVLFSDKFPDMTKLHLGFYSFFKKNLSRHTFRDSFGYCHKD